MAKRNRVFIPPEARATKPWFGEEPDDDIVAEIKEFIATTSRPYLWRGHTHTKPPPGATVVYLDEFCLPAPYRNNEDFWSPCPCCTDDLPQYMGTDRRPAKIAWFPEERVVRLIGHDCFKALNKDGHDRALSDLRKRQARKKDRRFLISNLSFAPLALFSIDHNLEIARPLDEFRETLLAKLMALPHFRFRDALRDGHLHIQEVVISTVVDRNKKEKEVKRTIDRVYATIRGHEILQAHRKDISKKFEAACEKLQGIDPLIDVGSLDDQQVRKLARDLAKGLQLAREASDEILLLRRFLSAETISTLRTWGSRSDAALRLFVELGDESFCLGPSADQKIRVAVVSQMFEVVATISMPGTGESVRNLGRDVA